ncbi:MAG: UDP-N-acetylmuramate dehydrogenase [Candidatus Algichlamydia australiensis]|nr:UDP-N-acetylmuramate dehydrogenase [Chlamydiales bacterium]
MSPFLEYVSLAKFTTFGIGGPARFFAEVVTIEQMQEVLRAAGELPLFILGNGSNLLFDDRGFDGLVIHNKIQFCNRDGGRFHVGAGYNFSLLGSQTSRLGFGGLEFASGIPGSVGGAVCMNAGANGAETKDSLESVGFVDRQGNFQEFLRKDLEFSYRTSPFQKKEGAIVSAIFSLEKVEGAREKRVKIVRYRQETQPYGEKSAGCIFRNPENSSAGALIEEAGLKGVQVGGAVVSEKHANFIVNPEGKAKAKDVLRLMELVQFQVKEKTGKKLEFEVRYVGFSR